MKNRNSKKGMTLIEILIVVTLLGILAGVLVKSLGGSLEAGKTASTKMFASTNLPRAIESYRAIYGKNPTSEDDIKPYLEGKQIPNDAWGTPYRIEVKDGKITGVFDSQKHGFDLKGDVIENE